MALPAGRKGVLPSELTPEGKIKNSASPYVLPVASADTLGGIKVGKGLSISDGVLSALSQTPTLTNITTLIDTERFASCDIYCADFGTFCLVSGNFETKTSIEGAGGWREVALLPAAPSKSLYTAGVAGFVDTSRQACDISFSVNNNGVLTAYIDNNNRGERYFFTFIFVKGGE